MSGDNKALILITAEAKINLNNKQRKAFRRFNSLAEPKKEIFSPERKSWLLRSTLMAWY